MAASRPTLRRYGRLSENSSEYSNDLHEGRVNGFLENGTVRRSATHFRQHSTQKSS
jgi:hypothetical protein